MMTEYKTHLTGRIDQAVRDWFQENTLVQIIPAKDLMPVFISKKIFKKDYRSGLPVRKLLRELDAENRLSLLKHCSVVRKDVNRNWYFERS